MHRIYSALIDIVAAAIFIVPLLALYGKISLRSLKQTLIYIVFAFYLVAVLSLVGFPSVLSLNLDFTINIIPLVDMISDFVNACLNVLLFVPLGFLLPMTQLHISKCIFTGCQLLYGHICLFFNTAGFEYGQHCIGS